MYKILADCRCSIDGITVLSYKKDEVIELDPKIVKILGKNVRKLTVKK